MCRIIKNDVTDDRHVSKTMYLASGFNLHRSSGARTFLLPPRGWRLVRAPRALCCFVQSPMSRSRYVSPYRLVRPPVARMSQLSCAHPPCLLAHALDMPYVARTRQLALSARQCPGCALSGCPWSGRVNTAHVAQLRSSHAPTKKLTPCDTSRRKEMRTRGCCCTFISICTHMCGDSYVAIRSLLMTL